MAANAFRSPASDRSAPCEGCGAPSPTADLTFSPDGRQICRRCAASVSVAQANARADGSFGSGAKVLNPVGKALTKAAARNPAAFGKLMMLAIIAIPVFVMVSVALAFAFGTWLRDLVH